MAPAFFFLAFFLAAPSSYRVDRGRHLAASTFAGVGLNVGSLSSGGAVELPGSRITFGQITVKDAGFSSLFGFVWLEKYHSRDLPNFCVFTQAGSFTTDALSTRADQCPLLLR